MSSDENPFREIEFDKLRYDSFWKRIKDTYFILAGSTGNFFDYFHAHEKHLGIYDYLTIIPFVFSLLTFALVMTIWHAIEENVPKNRSIAIPVILTFVFFSPLIIAAAILMLPRYLFAAVFTVLLLPVIAIVHAVYTYDVYQENKFIDSITVETNTNGNQQSTTLKKCLDTMKIQNNDTGLVIRRSSMPQNIGQKIYPDAECQAYHSAIVNMVNKKSLSALTIMKLFELIEEYSGVTAPEFHSNTSDVINKYIKHNYTQGELNQAIPVNKQQMRDFINHVILNDICLDIIKDDVVIARMKINPLDPSDKMKLDFIIKKIEVGRTACFKESQLTCFKQDTYLFEKNSPEILLLYYMLTHSERVFMHSMILLGYKYNKAIPKELCMSTIERSLNFPKGTTSQLVNLHHERIYKRLNDTCNQFAFFAPPKDLVLAKENIANRCQWLGISVR